MGRKKGKKSLEDKIRDLDANFLDEVSSLSPEQLKHKLAQIVGHAEEIFEAKENDVDLKEAEEKLKVLRSTYTEPLSAIKLKKTLLVRMLRDQGKL